MKKVKNDRIIEININTLDEMQDFSKAKLPEFKKAAKKVAKGMIEHFKKDGWDLSYNQYVGDIFYEATGHQLESYLLKELKGKNLQIKFGNNTHGLVIGKVNNSKKKKIKTQK